MDLEKIEKGLLRGQSEDLGLRQVSGNQMVDQALYATKETVPVECLVYSFHSYSLHPGDNQKPTVYDMGALRNGDSFNARQVAAIQNRKPVFYMTASFRAPEYGYEHQRATPPAPSPNSPHSEIDITRRLTYLLPPQIKDRFLCDKPLEIRPVEFHNPVGDHIAEPMCQVWLHINGVVPDDLHVHRYLLDYTSDSNFLPMALQPHGVGFPEPSMQVATIDHSMQFHRPSNINEWLLYSVESISTSNAHDFAHNGFYIQDGMLMTSAIQEEVVRNRNA